jgi:hypothetical protein
VARQQRQTRDLPERVLYGVYWSFRGGHFADLATFNEQVRQYQVDIGGEDTWSPDEIVIPCPRIRVAYVCWRGEEQLGPVVQLTSDDGEAFSAGELLFKVHNAVVGPLEGDNHCFFEGLTLHSPPSRGKPPVYVLMQGS